MKTLFILLFLFFSLSLKSEEHPLKHKKFQLIDSPSGHWEDGWVYIHDVLDYIFKSKDEKELAIKKLVEKGYSEKKTSYLYTSGNLITINGNIFKTSKEAQAYLINAKIKEVRVFSEEKDFPKEIKMDGVTFYIIPWDKRELPKIKL